MANVDAWPCLMLQEGRVVMAAFTICILVFGGGFCLCGLVTMLWQAAVARRFPLGRRVAAQRRLPSVTVIKPLHGSDPGMEQALKTWLQLDYGAPVEILLAVDSRDRVGRELVCRLLKGGQGSEPASAGEGRGKSEDSGVWVADSLEARMVVCSGERGANGKVAKIIEASGQARHEVWVVSDADVAVPPDLLQQVTAPLSDSQVGLSSCLYVLASPRTAAMRWEAVAVNVDFWSQVLQARSMGSMDFGLGAVMAVSKGWVSRAGGFEAVADYLADDFQLGNRIHAAGGRIELCTVTVACMDPQRGWRGVWRHQLRWGRTIRISRPGPYFASILGNALVGPAMWIGASAVLCLAGVVGATQSLVAGMTAFGLVAALRVGLAMDLQRRFVVEPAWRVSWWMVLVKDVLAIGIWVASFTGDRVEWRGQLYRVRRDGRLTKIHD